MKQRAPSSGSHRRLVPPLRLRGRPLALVGAARGGAGAPRRGAHGEPRLPPRRRPGAGARDRSPHPGQPRLRRLPRQLPHRRAAPRGGGGRRPPAHRPGRAVPGRARPGHPDRVDPPDAPLRRRSGPAHGAGAAGPVAGREERQARRGGRGDLLRRARGELGPGRRTAAAAPAGQRGLPARSGQRAAPAALGQGGVRPLVEGALRAARRGRRRLRRDLRPGPARAASRPPPPPW